MLLNDWHKLDGDKPMLWNEVWSDNCSQWPFCMQNDTTTKLEQSYSSYYSRYEPSSIVLGAVCKCQYVFRKSINSPTCPIPPTLVLQVICCVFKISVFPYTFPKHQRYLYHTLSTLLGIQLGQPTSKTLLYKVWIEYCTRCAVCIVKLFFLYCTRCAVCIVHCVQCVLYRVCSVYFTLSRHQNIEI